MDPTLDPTLEADVAAESGLLHMLAEAATTVDSEGGAAAAAGGAGNVAMAAAGGAGACSSADAPIPAESAQVSSLLQTAVGAGTALASGLAALSNRLFALNTCFRRKLRLDLINGTYALSPAALYVLTNPKARGILEGNPVLRNLINQVHNAGLSAAIEIGRVGRAIEADAGCAIVIRHLKMYLAYKILRDSLNTVLKPKLLELKIIGQGIRGGPVVGIPLGLSVASQETKTGDVETTIQTLNRLAAECGAEMGITPGQGNTMPTITAGQEEAAVAWLNTELEKETGPRTVTPGLSQPNRSSRFVAISGPNIAEVRRSTSKVQRNFLKELYDTFDKTDQQKMKERIDIFWAKVQARADYTGKTVASYLKTANEAIEKFLSDLAKSSVAARQRNAINKFLTSPSTPSTPSTPVLDYENVDTLLNGLEGALRLNDIPAGANSVARNTSAAKRPATNGAAGGGASTGGYRRSRRHRSKSTHRRSTRRRSTRRRSTHRRSTRSHSKL